MKIERVDEKTVKCYISNEELEEFEIDYKDFIMRSEKAKEIVQEIMEQAQEEVGYTPPKFAFDLQIMMVPDQGLVLTFSEKDPLTDMKDGEQILECLKEMKKVWQKNQEQREPEKKTQKAAEVRPDFAVFAFRSVGRVMEYASVLPKNLRVKSSLYLMNEVYYLHLCKGAASYERYSRACVQALEFAGLFAAQPDRVEYLKEHGECLIAERALKKLRMD